MPAIDGETFKKVWFFVNPWDVKDYELGKPFFS